MPRHGKLMRTTAKQNVLRRLRPAHGFDKSLMDDVRLSPDHDQTGDIAEGPSWAFDHLVGPQHE
jgi:hypothetical protein